MRLLSPIISIGLLIWVFWALLTTDESERISRWCKPVDWVGKVVISGVNQFVPDVEASGEYYKEQVSALCGSFVSDMSTRFDNVEEEELSRPTKINSSGAL